MKIAYITNSHIPSIYANGVQTMRMCEAIANLGHELILLIPTNEEESIQLKEDDTFSFYGAERVFEIKTTPFRKNPIQPFISSINAKLKRQTYATRGVITQHIL